MYNGAFFMSVNIMQKSPYLKTLIGFPLLTQLICTLVLFFTVELAPEVSAFNKLLFCAASAFAVATIPAFLIALWTRFYRYSRHALKGIVLLSFLIGLCYANISAACYLAFTDDAMSFGAWLRAGGLELSLMIAVGFALYSVLTLPWLLPENRPVEKS